MDLPRPRTIDLEFDPRFKAASDEVRSLIFARRKERSVTAPASRRALGDYVVPVATLLGALVLWEVATRVLHVPRFIMPAPSAILGRGLGVALSLHRPHRG